MKLFKLNVFSMALLIGLVSCEKDELNSESKTTSTARRVVVRKPDGHGRIYHVSKDSLDFKNAKGSALSRTTTSLPNASSISWTPLTKANIRGIGLSDDNVLPWLASKMLAVRGGDFTPYFNLLGVRFGNTADKVYGEAPINHDAGRAPVWRFSGPGTYTADTAFTPWTDYYKNGVNDWVETNKTSKGYYIEPREWYTLTKVNTSSINLSGSVAGTAGGKVGVPFVAEGEASVTVTVGASYTKEYAEEFSQHIYTPRVWLPAGKTVTFYLQERYVPAVSKWELPLEFAGQITFKASQKEIGFSTIIYNKYFGDNFKQDFKAYNQFFKDKKIIITGKQKTRHQLQINYDIK